MKIRTKTTKLSICDCGFPILADDKPLGTEYEIDLDDCWHGKVICGGCKKEIPIIGVYTSSMRGERPGYLPIQIFDPSEFPIGETASFPA